MYSRWARYYDALYAFRDYAGDAARLTALIHALHPAARTLLDVACGTGQHLRLLRESFVVEGLDANDEFFPAVALHSPGVPLHAGRMETFDLGRRFDVVTCLSSSIAFARTLPALGQTLSNLSRHLAPGGLLIVEPWFSPHNFWAGKVNAHYVDEPELKIAMIYTTAADGALSVLENRILVGTPEGLESLQETHELGLWTPAEYQQCIAEAGLALLQSEDPNPTWKRGVHVARAAATPA
jgi:SAM-dependent methyltransferase